MVMKGSSRQDLSFLDVFTGRWSKTHEDDHLSQNWIILLQYVCLLAVKLCHICSASQ